MPDRVHYHPDLIFSLGTQVVTLIDIPGAGKLSPAELQGISQTSCGVLREMGAVLRATKKRHTLVMRSTMLPGSTSMLMAETLSDLLNELNWNYIVNDILNEAAEAGYFKDGETKLLKDEAQPERPQPKTDFLESDEEKN